MDLKWFTKNQKKEKIIDEQTYNELANLIITAASEVSYGK
jgi:hypothetical protein